MSEHHYKATITWTGNEGKGTAGYREYQRSHIINVEGKPEIPASSDPRFGVIKQGTIRRNCCWLRFHRATCSGTCIYAV